MAPIFQRGDRRLDDRAEQQSGRRRLFRLPGQSHFAVVLLGRMRWIGLIAASALVAIIGAILIAGPLNSRPPGHSANQARAAVTPTSAVAPTATFTPGPLPVQCTVAGFTTFHSLDKTFCLAYPTGWTAQISPAGGGEEFNGPSGQLFQVATAGAGSGGNDPQTFDDIFCSVIGTRTAPVRMVNIGNQQWTREECEDTVRGLHALIEAVVYQGQLYNISYVSPATTFANDQARFYSTMEQSFSFLN